MTTIDAQRINSAACQIWFYLNLGRGVAAHNVETIRQVSVAQIEQAGEIIEALNAEPPKAKIYLCTVDSRQIPRIKQFCDQLTR